MKVVVLAVVALLCLETSAQFNRGANDYPVQGVPESPLKQKVVFTSETPDSVDPNLPEANLVVGVVSSPSHTAQRDAVRSSWAQLQSLTDPKLNSLSLEQKSKMVVRFVVGFSEDQVTERALAKEMAKYHDIIRVPVKEGYFNLTLKTGEFIKWAVSSYNCKWVFKCDDDSFVRIDKVLEEFISRGDSRVYMGKMWTGTPVDRRVDSFMPTKNYFTFAAGAGYGVSADLARYIARNYDMLHKWPMEDVAVGMWLSGLDVTYVDHPNFHSLPEGCDKHMIVQNPANATIMKEVFFHTVKGVPCHSDPDPFDPSTKNVPDHVLLELGIPKTNPATPNHHDAMQALAGQVLLDVDNSEDEVDGHEMDGMDVAMMNSNNPSTQAALSMNGKGEEGEEGLDAASVAAGDRMNEVVDMNTNMI